jgi:hypothetical protein
MRRILADARRILGGERRVPETSTITRLFALPVPVGLSLSRWEKLI